MPSSCVRFALVSLLQLFILQVQIPEIIKSQTDLKKLGIVILGIAVLETVLMYMPISNVTAGQYTICSTPWDLIRCPSIGT